jgi:hypothetical protein
MYRFIFLIFLALILLYIFLFSPIFKIRAIEVSGNQEIETAEIINKFDYQNIFLTTEKKVRDDFIKKIPKILDLKISKNFFKQRIKLFIKEREKAGIVCQGSPAFAEATAGKCFYIDKQGIIFEEAPQTSGSLILLIKDYSQRGLELGKEIFSEDLMTSVLKIRNDLDSEMNIKTLSFDVSTFPVKDLKVITNESWYVLFDAERDIKSQLLGLKAALKEKIKDRKNLEYIDLRIENRIYYK